VGPDHIVDVGKDMPTHMLDVEGSLPHFQKAIGRNLTMKATFLTDEGFETWAESIQNAALAFGHYFQMDTPVNGFSGPLAIINYELDISMLKEDLVHISAMFNELFPGYELSFELEN